MSDACASAVAIRLALRPTIPDCGHALAYVALTSPPGLAEASGAVLWMIAIKAVHNRQLRRRNFEDRSTRFTA